MDIQLTLTGKSPLLMHDPRLADPDEPTVRQIKAITDKRKKTEQDRREIEKLEWFGGLVLGTNGDGPAVKTAAIRKCFIDAGKISKQGTQIARALAFGEMFVPLEYDGPRDPKKLWENEAFRSRMSIRIGSSRTMRMRPQFVQWSCTVNALLLEDVMDIDDFIRIAERAGLAVGVGDARVLGYGRFSVTVAKV